MKIKAVKLVTHFDADEDGNKMPVLNPHFQVTTDDSEDVLRVPFDPLNMEYNAVKEWYAAHKIPGFKFDFKKNKPE